MRLTTLRRGAPQIVLQLFRLLFESVDEQTWREPEQRRAKEVDRLRWELESRPKHRHRRISIHVAGQRHEPNTQDSRHARKQRRSEMPHS